MKQTRTATATVGLVVAVAAFVLGSLSTGVAGAATGGLEAKGQWRPPGHTVVKVTGDEANGFTIERKDGTTLHPPTRSEVDAECSEYDTQLERVRCRTETRVWYRELAAMKLAITWARYDARRQAQER